MTSAAACTSRGGHRVVDHIGRARAPGEEHHRFSSYYDVVRRSDDGAEDRAEHHARGFQVRTTDGGAVVGEVQGVRPHGVRIHKIPGHAGHAGYLPVEAIERIEPATDEIVLRPGIGVAEVVDAPPPPDESPDGWHLSADWWADLLGHYGLFDPAGRGNEPYLHPDQK